MSRREGSRKVKGAQTSTVRVAVECDPHVKRMHRGSQDSFYLSREPRRFEAPLHSLSTLLSATGQREPSGPSQHEVRDSRPASPVSASPRLAGRAIVGARAERARPQLARLLSNPLRLVQAHLFVAALPVFWNAREKRGTYSKPTGIFFIHDLDPTI